MSHRSFSSTRVRFIRPCLESLEERNLLSNAGFTSFLNGVANNINQNIQEANALSKIVNNDTISLNADPHSFYFLAKLEVDCLDLIQAVSQTQELTSVFSDLEVFGAAAGLVTNDLSALGTLPPLPNPAVSGFGTYTAPLTIPNPANKTDTEYFDDKITAMQNAIGNLQNDAQAAGALMVAALSDFLFGTGNLPSLPTFAGLAGAIVVAPSVTENISPAPTEASASGPDITESVTVSNPTNSPVMATISYSATDGTTGGPVSKTITDTTDTVSLTVSPCSAGVVGTWTVTVDGQPTQTNTTTFTP